MNIKTTSVKIMSVILSVLMLFSAVYVGFTVFNDISADAAEVLTYSAINQYTKGDGVKDGAWDFELQNLGAASLPFESSNTDFAAPALQVLTGSTSLKASWDAFGSANNYTAKIYNVQNGAFTLANEQANLTTTEVTFTGLTTGDTYYVQILAYNDANLVGASVAAKIIVSLWTETFKVVNDMSDLSSITSTFPNTELQTTNVGTNYANDADVTGIKFDTGVNNITFNIPATDLSQYEAVAFYIDAATPFSFEDLLTGASKKFTNVLKDNNAPATNVSNIYVLKADGSLSNHNTCDWQDTFFNINAGDKFYLVFTIGNSALSASDYVTDKITLQATPWHHSSAANRGKPYYIDNLTLISNVELFCNGIKGNKEPVAEQMVVNKDPIIAADSFNKTTNVLSNASSIGTGYYFSYGSLGFKLTKDYGAKLTFTAPEDGTYEFNGNLFVKENTAAKGVLKYKLVKTDTENVETIIWPTNGNEKYIAVTSSDLNPKADDFDYTVVELKKGEKVSIYTSMNFTAGDSLTVNLGSPVMIPGHDIFEDSKGLSVEYNWTNYTYQNTHRIYTDAEKDTMSVGAADFVENKSFVDYKGFTFNSGTGDVSYAEEDNYNATWGNYLHFANGSAIHTNADSLVIENAADNGVALVIKAPFTGAAEATFVNSPGRFRVLVNGTKVYPENSDWYTGSGEFTVSVNVNEGDTVSYEFLKNAAGSSWITETNKIKTHTFKFIAGNTNNAASNNSFAAQLERPYVHKAYSGDFVASESSIFTFGALDVNSGTVVLADTYKDTENNHLYNSVSPYDGAGFYFDDDERLLLDVTGSDSAIIGSGVGGAISFKAPLTSIYDVTTGLSFESGSGTANYRIVYDGEVVWPTEGGWYAVSSSEEKEIPAVLVSATAGKEIVLQYAVSNNSNKVTLDLGAPTVYKVPATIPAAKGYMDVFAPALYEPKTVSGKDVVVNKAGNRYKFYKLDASYNQTELTNYNADTHILKSADDSVALDFSTGEIVATLKANTGASLKLDLPKGGLSNIYIKTNTGTVKVRALVNGTVVADWTDTAADGSLGIEIIETELNLGDVVELQVFSDHDETVGLGAPSVAVVGDHMVGNFEADELFYPLNDDPYKGSAYTGEYVQPLKIWNFNTFNSTAPETLETINYYDSTQDRYAYNTNMLNAGFKFATTGLKAVLTNDGTNYYGSSVEFIAPAKFDADMLWSFITENPNTDTGKLYVRITRNDQVIWPETEGADWEIFEFTGGDALDFPLYELSLNKGDSLKIELYASDTAANTVTVNMKFPVIKFTGKSRFLSPDAQADVYAIQNYNPYGESEYDGPHTPVESRWNFELLTYTATEHDPSGALAESDTFAVSPVPNYKKSWNHYLMGHNNEGYHIAANGTSTGEIYNKVNAGANTFTSHGLSWRFVSPITGTAKLLGAPNPGSFVTDVLDEHENVIGTNYKHYYFRIQLNGETIWPTDSDWAHLHSENKLLGFTGMDLDLNAGDQIECQLFMKTFDQDGNPVAISSGLIDLGNTSIVLVDPESVTTGKTRFNPSTDWTTEYQISPYWSYEVSYDNEVYDWQPISSWYGGFGMWRDTAVGQLGIARDYTWFYDGDGKHAALARTLTIENDGYIQIVEGKAALSAALGDNPKAIIKIMCNDETWLTSTEFDASYSYLKINKAVKAGDKVRFIMTLTEGTGTGWSTYIRWTPTISWSKRNFESTGDKNIFQGLNDAMLEYFKTLDSSPEFDIDFEANKWLSENPPQEEEIISSSSEPQSSEETSSQDTQTSSKRKKKTVTTYQIISGTPIWLIILIIVGAVVIVGGIVILLILKKRGIIFAPKPAGADDGESAEGMDDINTSTDNN